MPRICALEAQFSDLISNAGHPAMTVTQSGDTFVWDPINQRLVLPVAESTTQSVDTVRWADNAARALLAPVSTRQIGIQTTDATNGNNSLWVATGLTPGDWVIKVSGMAAQSAAAVAITGGVITGVQDIAVADGGTGASTVAGARTNLTLPSLPTTGNNLDWSLSDNFYIAVAAPVTLTFTNAVNGKAIRLAAVMGGNHALTFPAGIKWVGAAQPTHSNSNTDLYEFRQINGVIYGDVVKNFG